MASQQQNSQGIQTLLEAEKEAAKQISKARLYRVNRLKDAKADAQKETEALKQAKEREFQLFLEKNGKDDSLQAAEAEMNARLESIKAAFAEKKSVVIEKLMDTIIRIEPKIHENTKLLMKQQQL